MKKRLSILVVILSFSLLSANVSFAEVIGDSFTLVKAGKPSATIVIGSKQNLDTDMYFARIVADTVKQITDVDIPIAEKAEEVTTPNQILIGSPEDVPLIKKLLTQDEVIRTKEDVEKYGYCRNLLIDDLGTEGFVIYNTARGSTKTRYLILTASTHIGLGYAANTLADRLHIEADSLIVDGLKTHLMPIVNMPAFEHRSLQTALGGPDWLGPNQYFNEFGYDYKAFIDWLVSHKINNILLQSTRFAWGLPYKSEKLADLVNPDSPNVKKDFLRDMMAYGRKRGVTFFLLQNFPDRANFVIKARPDLAGIDKDGKAHKGTFCINKPEVMQLWKEFWKDVLDHYPQTEAAGVQFCEHLGSRCQCSFCNSEKFFAKNLEFYEEMRKIAQNHNPPVKTWIWSVPGAREILARWQSYPDLTVIDWGLDFMPFALKHYIPRGDWYLHHKSGKHTAYSVKQMCHALNRYNIEGIQIRAIKYKPNDIKYQYFEEFTWNPDMTIEDYAHLYTIKKLRRKDEKIASAYAHYIYARGYYDLLLERVDPKKISKPYRIAMVTEQWAQMEDYHAKINYHISKSGKILNQMAVKLEFTDWLKARHKELSALVRYWKM